MKRQPAAVAEGAWWRFSYYEIADGWIRPTAGAQLERYDPWQAFWATRNVTVGQAPAATQPPYQTLMKLVHGLEYKPGAKRYPDCLTAESLSRITKWCQAHGPLGVLLSRWESIALAPISRKSGDFVQRRYVRGTGQSIQQIESSGDVGRRRPTVVMHELDNVEPKEEPPGRTWHRFFPSVEFSCRDRFQYPIPYSDEFCETYTERVGDFCSAAWFLTGAILHLQRVNRPPVEDPELAQKQALQAINLLRRSVTSILDFDDDGRPLTFWEAPSLLASFAEMYVEDLLFGRPAMACSCCRAPFVSSAYQAQFCSLACRYRGQKRRLRQQMKQAKVLRAEKKSVREIAATLGQTREVVAGWLAKT
jgi:hypothetical protein